MVCYVLILVNPSSQLNNNDANDQFRSCFPYFLQTCWTLSIASGGEDRKDRAMGYDQTTGCYWEYLYGCYSNGTFTAAHRLPTTALGLG